MKQINFLIKKILQSVTINGQDVTMIYVMIRNKFSYNALFSWLNEKMFFSAKKIFYKLAFFQALRHFP